MELEKMPGNQAHWWSSEEVAALTGAPENTRRVYMALRGHCYAGKNMCWPKVERLAQLVGCSHRTVQRALRWLERAKLVVTVQRRVSRTWNLSSMYRLTMLSAVRAAEGAVDRIKSTFRRVLDRVTPDPDGTCHPEQPSADLQLKKPRRSRQVFGRSTASPPEEYGPSGLVSGW